MFETLHNRTKTWSIMANLDPQNDEVYKRMLDSYGAWDRSLDAKADYLKGFRISIRWKELEPNQEVRSH